MDKLANNTDFFRNLFNTIPLIIFILNAKGRIVEINDTARKFIDEHNGDPVYQGKLGGDAFNCFYSKDNGCTLHSDCKDCDVRNNCWEALNGNSVIQAKGKIKIEDKTIHLLISACQVQGINEKYAIIILEDITEKLLLEEEVFKTQKLESIGILAGGLAHDFNNYLAAMMANIQLASIRLGQGVDIEPILKKAEDVIIQAAGLTRQLLALSKGGTPVKKISSLKDLVIETSKFVLRGKRVSYTLNIPDDLWLAEIDSNQIAQVITNLLINASQSMLTGVITIDCENVILNPMVNVPLPYGEYVKISIKDQGCGIQEEDIYKIFDPFFTTKEEGTGLGLTVCYSIIRNHSGFIGVDSTLNQGTTFYFYLPAINIHQPFCLISDIDDFSDKGEHGKILLMDDEIDITIPLCEMLREVGYEVVLAKEGTEAIFKYIKAQKDGEPYDVVILDLTVPGGMSIERTIEQLMKINPDIKVIVSSGDSDNHILNDPCRYHFREGVMKPYRIEALRRILRKLIG